VKKRFDVDDCLKSKNSVDEAAQTVNELNCYCDLSAVGYGAVGYLCLVFCFAIRCSSVLERPRVAHKLEFRAATIAFKLSRLVARLVTKKLELRIAREIMARSVKKIVRCLCFSLLHQRQLGYSFLATCELVDTILTSYSDVEEGFKRGSWPKAVVTETVPDSDDAVRRERVKSAASSMCETYENCVFPKPVTEEDFVCALCVCCHASWFRCCQ